MGDRPVIDYLLDRLEAADCDEIRVVRRAEKRDVVERAAARGARVLLGEPDSLSSSIALGLHGLDAAANVLLGFPDTIWETDF